MNPMNIRALFSNALIATLSAQKYATSTARANLPLRGTEGIYIPSQSERSRSKYAPHDGYRKAEREKAHMEGNPLYRCHAHRMNSIHRALKPLYKKEGVLQNLARNGFTRNFK